jgi:hypothetical protein
MDNLFIKIQKLYNTAERLKPVIKYNPELSQQIIDLIIDLAEDTKKIKKINNKC